MNETNFNPKHLYTIGGISALAQLTAILSYTIALAVLGPKLTSAAEYFAVHQESPLAMALRGDFLLLILIGPYFGTFPALWWALRRASPLAATFATLFTFVAVTICFASESTFAMLELGGQYAATASEAVRAQLLAAGEAVIASDMWNSSGAYVSGFLMQGGGVVISLSMLRSSRDFSKVTAWAGLLGNGFDLIQHALHPFAPSTSSVLMGDYLLTLTPGPSPRERGEKWQRKLPCSAGKAVFDVRSPLPLGEGQGEGR
ncbi:MAG: hypothetical protein ACOYYU_16970 [Chloroflexota bacterium]